VYLIPGIMEFRPEKNVHEQAGFLITIAPITMFVKCVNEA
jgi:hypothetical protein